MSNQQCQSTESTGTKTALNLKYTKPAGTISVQLAKTNTVYQPNNLPVGHPQLQSSTVWTSLVTGHLWPCWISFDPPRPGRHFVTSRWVAVVFIVEVVHGHLGANDVRLVVQACVLQHKHNVHSSLESSAQHNATRSVCSTYSFWFLYWF